MFCVICPETSVGFEMAFGAATIAPSRGLEQKKAKQPTRSKIVLSSSLQDEPLRPAPISLSCGDVVHNDFENSLSYPVNAASTIGGSMEDDRRSRKRISKTMISFWTYKRNLEFKSLSHKTCAGRTGFLVFYLYARFLGTIFKSFG